MPANNPGEVHALFVHAFNNEDIDALLAMYEPTAILVVGTESAVGSRAIRSAFESHLRRRARMTLETRSMIISEKEGLAVLHGAWILTPLSADAAEGTTRGISTEVVRRQADGTWLFVIDNPNTPLA